MTSLSILGHEIDLEMIDITVWANLFAANGVNLDKYPATKGEE